MMKENVNDFDGMIELEESITEVFDTLSVEEMDEMLRWYSLQTEIEQTGASTGEEIKNRIIEKTNKKIESYSTKNLVREDNTYADRIEDNELFHNSLHQPPSNNGSTKDKPRKNLRKWMIGAAASILVLFGVSNYGAEIVKATTQLFQLIPGLGIIEKGEVEEESITQCLKESVKITHGKEELELVSAFIKGTNLYITLKWEGNQQEEIDKSEEIIGENEIDRVKLFSGTKDYKRSDSYSIVGGSTDITYHMSFELENDEVSENEENAQTYSIQYNNWKEQLSFELIDVEQYNALEQIGSSQQFNQINLTATVRKDNNTVKVNIYPVNHSKYQLMTFQSEYDFSLFNKNLVLETEKGELSYTLPDSYGSRVNPTYIFDNIDGATHGILKIPYVQVQGLESKKITLPVPDKGEEIEVNEKLMFEEGIAHITKVERVEDGDENGNGSLRIHLNLEDLQEDIKFFHLKFTRETSESWAEEYDQDGRLIYIDYALDKSNSKNLKFKVMEPEYVFMDEYKLALEWE